MNTSQKKNLLKVPAKKASKLLIIAVFTSLDQI